jgi:hypothetical protein
VFRDDQDRQGFLDALVEAAQQFGVRQAIKRLEAVARTSAPLNKRLEQLRKLSRVKR